MDRFGHKSGPSLAFRAILALILMVGFYIMALSIAGILFYIPYADTAYFHRLHFKLAVVCMAAGAAVL